VQDAAGPEDAAAEMDRMLKDTKHPLHSKGHPDYQAAIDRYLALGKIAARGRA